MKHREIIYCVLRDKSIDLGNENKGRTESFEKKCLRENEKYRERERLRMREKDRESERERESSMIVRT